MNKDSVEDGVVVSMEYTLRVDDEVVDSSEGQDPLEFLTGYGNIISGLEREMMGMKIGDVKDVLVSAADGYDELDQNAFMEVPRRDFSKDMPIRPGMELQLSDEHGNQMYARSESAQGDSVRLDLNHPLAGKELYFNVKVVGLRDATHDELEHGHAHVAGHHH